MNFDCTKYKRANFQPKNFKDRQWPDKEITKAPIWCSVDLRDGNQSLPIPMNVDEKIKIYTTTEGLRVEQFRELLRYYPIQHSSKLEKAMG